MLALLLTMLGAVPFDEGEAVGEVGVTPEMVEEHLEILSEFEFTEESDEAFSEKLSEFIGEEVSLREIRNRRRGNRRE